ncbi:hypothetical protein F5X68DRAFT_277451 [Plectosphaerella plurivora]|uniref:Pyrroloquinoline quinone-dependent pyranose dehydrogenase beta-propeller domain-containing protein n=1 Tax=Plectosphaerella plurivora TaxID=936078 RepID=A0A9P9A6S4_9PEZI|nr:hypothetical protein F5X68DRAFT_277451 [Plectosphaerella plurivora]
MLSHFTSSIWLLVLQSASSFAAEACSNTLEPDYSAPIAGDGWSYRLVTKDLLSPRSILVDGRGALLVLDAGSGIKRLVLKDDGGTCVSRQDGSDVVRSSELNHGLALSVDGRTLYASSSDKVYAWPYSAEEGRVTGDNSTVVTGMINGGHTSRTLLASQQFPGMLVVARGSQGNLDPLCEDETSGHCQIRAFNMSNNDPEKPFNFTTDGMRLGWGLRNSVGVAENPTVGGVWSVENSVDNLERAGEDIHRDNPGEELNFHGYLNGTDDGGNYGYPDCLALWSTDGFPDRGDLSTGDQFNAPTGSGTVNDTRCGAERVAPRLTFQAHTAPLDILFTPDGSEALVTFHGSWNRDDPVGYKLSSISFRDGQPAESSDSTTAAQDVLSNGSPGDCPDRCFRPVGLAWDREERLYMTSDSTGEVYVLMRSEASATEPGSNPTATSVPDASTLLSSSGLTMLLGMAAAAVVLGRSLGGSRR